MQAVSDPDHPLHTHPTVISSIPTHGRSIPEGTHKTQCYNVLQVTPTVLYTILLTQCPAEHIQAVPSDQGTSWQILYLEPTAEMREEEEDEKEEEEKRRGK